MKNDGVLKAIVSRMSRESVLRGTAVDAECSIFKAAFFYTKGYENKKGPVK